MLKKFFLFFLVGIGFQSISWAQFADNSGLLPVDSAVKVGRLENGITYYIRNNKKPAQRLELRLVVKVGSMQEDEDQLGLAHFVEHMAFNGTKNFPKNKLIDYMESIGMAFGAEINAYTSFDETVYMLTVPTDSLSHVQNGFQILADWAHQISFEPEEIDKERGVIKEEWRLGRGADERMMQKIYPVIFKDSKYALRLPIGKPEVFTTCSYETLTRFYNEWYRPELMAVVVVGDMSADSILAVIQEKFGQIPLKSNPRQKINEVIPDHEKPAVVIAKDAEANTNAITMYIKHPEHIIKTRSDYRKRILYSLYDMMMNNRLQELHMQANPPFLGAFAGYSSFLGKKDVYYVSAVTANNALLSGFKPVLLAIKQVKDYGFTTTELERAKESILASIEQVYLERDKTYSEQFSAEYVDEFLSSNNAIPGIAYEYEMYKSFVPAILLDEVNALSHKWVTPQNRVITVTAPQQDTIQVPTEKEIVALLKEVEKEKVAAFVDDIKQTSLIQKTIVSGKIEKSSLDTTLGTLYWTLSNGAKVVIKPTTFQDDQVILSAYSVGGYSQYTVAEDMSAKNAATIAQLGGIGDFSLIQLGKTLAGKSVYNVHPWISEYHEGIYGTSSVKDISTLFELSYMLFAPARRDDQVFSGFIKRNIESLQNRAAVPEVIFADSIRLIKFKNHPREQVITATKMAEISYDKALEIYQDRFSDPSNFTYIIVGNIDTTLLKPLVEKYLGSFPKVDRQEVGKDMALDKPTGRIEKIIHKGKENKAKVYLSMFGSVDTYTYKELIHVDAVSTILESKLYEIIREEKSGVYGISVTSSLSGFPKKEFDSKIIFGCNPALVDTLILGVKKVIADFVANGPTQHELDKYKEKQLKNYETAVKTNDFWVRELKMSQINGYKEAFYTQYKKIINDLMIADIQQAMALYFNDSNSMKVVLLPEEK